MLPKIIPFYIIIISLSPHSLSNMLSYKAISIIPSIQSFRSEVWGHFHLHKIILVAVIQPIVIRVNAFFAKLGTTDQSPRRHGRGFTRKLELNHSSSTLQVLKNIPNSYVDKYHHSEFLSL